MEYPHAKRIDLLLPDVFRELSAYPERLKEIVCANKDDNVFIIDEVQKIPQLLELVHSLIEENKNRVFILTGSSARKLKRAGVDLLAGRALMRKCHSFMASELGDLFDLKQALEYGMLPVVIDSTDKKRCFETHIYLCIYKKKFYLKD